MSGSNGHAHGNVTAPANGAELGASPDVIRTWDGSNRFIHDEIKRHTDELEVPFDPLVIEWRVTNTSHDKSRGQVIPYADQRAYTDRLNALFTPAGWTRKYTIHTSANFERSKDQKIAAKVLVTCELTIFGLGSHSATGEEWADNDNAGTSAEAQAFKRACSCFGLGRYLYHFEGTWVDLDERKRPMRVPQLPKWATPEGWTQGLRPNVASKSNGARDGARAHDGGSERCGVGESNRGPGGTARPRALPRTVARPGKGLEPTGDPGDSVAPETVGAHAISRTWTATRRSRSRQDRSGSSRPHPQDNRAHLA